MAYNSSQFSNANGVTFGTVTGLSGNVITASVNGGGAALQGSGTYTQNTGTIQFSNSNGVTFGLSNNGVMTASVAAAGGAQTGISGLSAGTTQMTSGTAVFSNSNGISFGVNGNTVTASYNSTQFQTTGNYLTTAMLSNAVTISNINISGGTTSSNLSNFKLIDSNGVSWSVDTGSKIYATVKTDYQTSGAYLTTADLSQNSSKYIQNWKLTGNSAGTQSSAQGTDLWLAGGNGVTISGSSNTLSFSVATNYQSQGAYLTTAMQSNAVTISNVNISAGTTSTNASAFTFSNSNGLAFGLGTGANVGVVTGSYTVPTVTNSSFSVQDSATTINPVNRIAFSTGNNITLSLSTGASSVTVGVSHNLAGTSTGFGGNLISGSMTHNSSGLNLSLNHPAWLTTAALSGDSSKYVQNWKLTGNTAGTTSSANGTDLWFSGGNNVTISGSSGSLVFSVGNYITTARASTDAVGLNTALTAGPLAWTVNSSGISLNASSAAGTTSGFAGANISGSITHNTAGINLSLSVAAQSNQTLGMYALGNTTQNSSTTFDARTAGSFNALGAMTMGFSNGSIQVSAPATSSLVGVGAITISTNGSTISISGGTVASAPVGVSAGTTSNSLSQIVFSNSNGVSFGLNGSTITGSAGVMGSWYQNVDGWNGMVTGGSAITQTSGSSMFIQPFFLPYSISAGYFRFLASFNDSAVGTAGTTSANTSFSAERYSTFGLVIYSQGVGASSRSIQSVGSTSAGLTGRTVYTAGAQGSQYTMSVLKTFPNSGAAAGNYNTSYAVSSASIVISSNSNTLFTGPRFLDVSFATSFAPGNYWLGIGHSTNSASNSSNISFAGTAAMPISLAGISQSNVSVGVLGAATSASDHQLIRGLGVFTTNASLITTGSIGFNSISQVVSNPQLPFQIIREA